MTQKPLDFGDRYRYSQAWDAILEQLNRAVVNVGRKEAAYQLDTSPSVLSNALAERDRHVVRAPWLPYLTAAAPDNSIVEILAGLRGLTIAPAVELTPEQKLDRLTRALEGTLGADLVKALYERAWR